jgi:hypothetical protein
MKPALAFRNVDWPLIRGLFVSQTAPAAAREP